MDLREPIALEGSRANAGRKVVMQHIYTYGSDPVAGIQSDPRYTHPHHPCKRDACWLGRSHRRRRVHVGLVSKWAISWCLLVLRRPGAEASEAEARACVAHRGLAEGNRYVDGREGLSWSQRSHTERRFRDLGPQFQNVGSPWGSGREPPPANQPAERLAVTKETPYKCIIRPNNAAPLRFAYCAKCGLGAL